MGVRSAWPRRTAEEAEGLSGGRLQVHERNSRIFVHQLRHDSRKAAIADELGCHLAEAARTDPVENLDATFPGHESFIQADVEGLTGLRQVQLTDPDLSQPAILQTNARPPPTPVNQKAAADLVRARWRRQVASVDKLSRGP